MDAIESRERERERGVLAEYTLNQCSDVIKNALHVKACRKAKTKVVHRICLSVAICCQYDHYKNFLK